MAIQWDDSDQTADSEIIWDSEQPQAAVAPSRFAKPDGGAWTPETLPEGERLDPMTFIERMGKRFTENQEAFANAPGAMKRVITGEGEGMQLWEGGPTLPPRGVATLQSLGVLAPLANLTAPIGAAVEHPYAAFTGKEEQAQMAGNVSEMLTPLILMKLGQMGKLSKAGEAIAAAMGATPGITKAAPGVQDFIKKAGGEVAAGERAAMSDMLESIVKKTQGAEFDPTLPRPVVPPDSPEMVARLMKEPKRLEPQILYANEFPTDKEAIALKLPDGRFVAIPGKWMGTTHAELSAFYEDIGGTLDAVTPGRIQNGRWEGFNGIKTKLSDFPERPPLPPEVAQIVDTAGQFDRIKTATPEEVMARLMSEQPSQAPFEAMPTAVREAIQDPAAMARTSSLLEAAQSAVVPRPGNLTAGAAMETGMGQVERLLPKQTDFFRTTQEMIEKATGKQGAELLKERDALAEQIQEVLVARKNASEMVATEAMVDAVAPRVIKPAPSVLANNSPVKGMNVKDFDRFLLTGHKPALAKVSKTPVATDVAAGVLGVEGKAIQPGPARMLFEGMFKESTRQVAGFGAAGKLLSREMVGALDKGEREAGAAVTAVQQLVKGLSGAERESLVDFMDTGAQALTPRVAEAGTKIRALLDDVAKRATGAQMSIKNPLTGVVVPWTPRADGNYFPHFANVDLEEIFQNPRRMAEAVKEIAADNGVSLAEADEMLEFMRKNGQKRYGNLEMSRVMNFRKWDRDPERVLSKYFTGAYKRLNLAETFNADYSRADQMVEMIRQQSNDNARGMAKTYVDRILGRESSWDEAWKTQLSHDVRNFETATKLGQAVIANASQPVLLATVAGYKNTFKAVGDVMFRNGSEFAGMTGATLDATMAQIQRELGAGSAGQWVLRRTGFSAVERFNRILSANAGKHFAQDQFRRLRNALDSGATSRANYYREELGKLGINPAEAIGRGSLSLDDLYKAGQLMTKRTQFKTGTADLPIFATSDLGKVLYQFKSFSFKSAQLFKDEIVKEAARGNFAPLVRASLLMPLAGELVNDVQALVNGKSRPDNLVARIADNFAAVGAFGLLYTGFKSLGYGPGAALSQIVGPAITDIGKLGTNIYGAVTGKPKPLARQVVSAVPVVGTTIANRFWPTQEEQRLRRGQ